MQKTCLKCGQVNPSATDDASAACPQCGVIYAKFDPERWQALQVKRDEARHDAAVRQSRSKDAWKYWVLSIAVLILIPMWIYQEVWGISAQRRKSEAQRHVVTNSGWDGSVHQVESYLKRNLKDPASFEAIEWSQVARDTDNNFVVRVKYRAKNSFGGYVIEQQMFRLDLRGEVIGATKI